MEGLGHRSRETGQGCEGTRTDTDMRGLGPRCGKNQDQDTGTGTGAWRDWGRNSGAGPQREHRVRVKGQEHGVLGQGHR